MLELEPGCRVCHAQTTPAERAAYGTLCENCYTEGYWRGGSSIKIGTPVSAMTDGKVRYRSNKPED